MVTLGRQMSQENPQPARFSELYPLARTFFEELLTLLRLRFGDPPQWPVADFYDIQFERGSAQESYGLIRLAKREYPIAALYSIWGAEVVSLASFEPLMKQLQALVEAKQIQTTFFDTRFLLPFVKQYLAISGSCAFDQGVFEEVYKLSEEYLTKESVTGTLFIELVGLKADSAELILSPQHRILKLDEGMAKHIWTVATSAEVPLAAFFRPAGGIPTPQPGSVIIEATFEVKSAKLNEAPLVRSQEFRACALALRLCEPGGGGIEPITEEYEPLVPAIVRSGEARGLISGLFSYSLDTSVAARVKQAWPTCYAFASELARNDAKVPPPLKIAAGRFAESFGKHGKEDRLIDYVIAMEALLGRENEAISYRIPLRLATLIGDSPTERVRIFDISKKSYELRSKLVHGSGELGRSVTVKGIKIPWGDFLSEVQGYLIRCIRLFMKARERSINKDEVLAIIERVIVSQDRTELERGLCQ